MEQFNCGEYCSDITAGQRVQWQSGLSVSRSNL
jgi:hypothetical protein